MVRRCLLGTLRPATPSSRSLLIGPKDGGLGDGTRSLTSPAEEVHYSGVLHGWH